MSNTLYRSFPLNVSGTLTVRPTKTKPVRVLQNKKWQPWSLHLCANIKRHFMYKLIFLDF